MRNIYYSSSFGEPCPCHLNVFQPLSTKSLLFITSEGESFKLSFPSYDPNTGRIQGRALILEEVLTHQPFRIRSSAMDLLLPVPLVEELRNYDWVLFSKNGNTITLQKYVIL